MTQDNLTQVAVRLNQEMMLINNGLTAIIPIVGTIENGQVVFDRKTVVVASYDDALAKVDPRIVHDSSVSNSQ